MGRRISERSSDQRRALAGPAPAGPRRPEVSGPGLPLLLAMTGRLAAMDALSGDGVAILSARIAAG